MMYITLLIGILFCTNAFHPCDVPLILLIGIVLPVNAFHPYDVFLVVLASLLFFFLITFVLLIEDK